MPLVSSSVQDLVNSYSYNYFGEELDVANITSSASGSALSFSINVSNVTAGTYTFYVDVKDLGSVVSGKNTGTINSQGAIVNVDINNYLLSGATNFNYSLRVYDSSDILVYRETNRSTGTISPYNPGYLIGTITPQNIGNHSLQIAVLFNSTRAATNENFSFFLKYNNGSYIFSTKNQSLTTGLNAILFLFDNETMKSTHYNGVYNMTSMTIGQKNIPIGTNTATFNYETFAKTSYFKKYNSTFKDLDADNLTDRIDFNFTATIKTAGTYTIEAEISDLYDNHVTTLSQTELLSTGNKSMIIPLNGSDLYSIGIDGPYQISESRLIISGVVVDSEFEKYNTSSISYFDFERPPLPDLVPHLTFSQNLTGNTTITVNLTNTGNASALNIFLDVFDDSNLDSSSFLSILNASSSFVFTLSANISNSSVVVVLADIYNDVDETNETNNFDYWTTSVVAPPNDTNRFLIQNSSSSTVAWLGDWGNIALKGTCSISSNCIAPTGSLVMGNFTDNSTAYISPAGDLCLESGSCSALAGSCNPSTDSFLIQNTTGYNMSYISSNGNLCYTGGLYQNVVF